MKTTYLLTFLFLFSLTPAVRAQSPREQQSVPVDWLDQASFTKVEAIQKPPRKSLGIVTPTISGWGFVFKKPITEQRSLFSIATYKPKNTIYWDDFHPTQQTGNIDAEETYNYRLYFGVDELFHITGNKNWGLLGGLGVALSQSRYEIRLYRPLCNFFICGFDPASVENTTQDDFYGFVSARLGLQYNVQLWGSVGQLAFSIHPELITTSKNNKFKNIEGDELHPVKTTPLFIEATINLE